MSWTEEKVNKLTELWGKGKTASQIAEIIGGISRNAVIGKAHRLNLSAKIKTRTPIGNQRYQKLNPQTTSGAQKFGRKSRFKSLIIEKDFPPESPKNLEELEDGVCRWPVGHPDEKNFYFCGRGTIKIGNRQFPYCKLHVLYSYQSKDKKEDNVIGKEHEMPNFLQKKIKSA